MNLSTILIINAVGLILLPIAIVYVFIKRSKEDKQTRQLRERKGTYGTAYRTLYFIAFLNFFLGIAPLFTNNEIIQEIGHGVYSIAEGLMYFILAIFVQRKSVAVIISATVIYGFESYIELSALLPVNKVVFFGILPTRLIFFSFILGGIGAIGTLNKTKNQ